MHLARAVSGVRAVRVDAVPPAVEVVDLLASAAAPLIFGLTALGHGDVTVPGHGSTGAISCTSGARSTTTRR